MVTPASKPSQLESDATNNQDSLMTRCFQIDPSVELKDVPSSGEEYLLKVMKEREKCIVITKYSKDISKFAKNQSLFVEERQLKSAPDLLKPTIEWQNFQVADFSEVRLYISKLQNNKKLWPQTVIKIKIEYNDLVGWKIFFDKNSPTLSCVFGLNQALLDQGLEVLISSLKNIKPGDTIDEKTGRWIYAFIACVRLPLLSDTLSILRDLARRCAEIRSHINIEEESATLFSAPLNIFICLVSRYFRQTDLAD